MAPLNLGMPDRHSLGSVVPHVRFAGDGLLFTADASGSVVSGLAIYGFQGDALEFNGGGNNLAKDNYLGIAIAGDGPGNGRSGLRIQESRDNTVSGNVVGRNDAAGIFVFGTSSNDNVFTQNMIGSDPSGITARPNREGIQISQGSGNQIGLANQGNLISGNLTDGIIIAGNASTNNSLQGNIVGLTAVGDAELSNQGNGISVKQSGNNTIGGTGPGQGNIVSGNQRVRHSFELFRFYWKCAAREPNWNQH